VRIWSLHPEYLDAKGLVALWRETLLAQHVLLGKTKGYMNHPQLERFKTHVKPIEAISVYLKHVYDEADKRGYRFDRDKIAKPGASMRLLAVTSGQMQYEWAHLKRKLKIRDPKKYRDVVCKVDPPNPHPLFSVVEGKIESWERF
jgi:hypothetical protein